MTYRSVSDQKSLAISSGMSLKVRAFLALFTIAYIFIEPYGHKLLRSGDNFFGFGFATDVFLNSVMPRGFDIFLAISVGLFVILLPISVLTVSRDKVRIERKFIWGTRIAEMVPHDMKDINIHESGGDGKPSYYVSVHFSNGLRYDSEDFPSSQEATELYARLRAAFPLGQQMVPYR
jgi:hypothetical protein